MHLRILRTIDANINRVGEGLRVLEDICRFIVEDEDASNQLKSIRHQLNIFATEFGLNLLEHRDVQGDVGGKSDLTHDHSDLISIVRANAKRTEEGLRVLEELAKLPEIKPALSAVSFKEARYNVYSIEKALVKQLIHNQKSD